MKIKPCQMKTPWLPFPFTGHTAFLEDGAAGALLASEDLEDNLDEEPAHEGHTAAGCPGREQGVGPLAFLLAWPTAVCSCLPESLADRPPTVGPSISCLASIESGTCL